jgi:hypothetical protein
MATATHKRKKTAEQIIEGWFARQDMTLSDEARANWEAGQVPYTDFIETIRGETVITHCERYFADDESGRFVVVCWDEDGNITIGGTW